ncbi:MAG: carbohydrate ABC transporter permease [Chloroflexi bacterium]|nr:carbohydrate ABC transporter permease [Chloroflexota bacterium]
MANVMTLKNVKISPTMPRWWHRLGGIRTAIFYAVMVAISAFSLFPLVWMAGTSLKTAEEANRSQLNIIPETAQWDNYTHLLKDDAFQRAYLNSIFVTTMVLLGTTVSVSLVAFAFSRLEWKGRNIVFALMLGTLMVPDQMTMVPQYVLFFKLGWLRSFNPITLPGFFAGGAALIFLLRQFMMTIPKEIDEAAMMDGANPLQIWWYIIMPLCRPAIATISIFLFVGNWNSLFRPIVYLKQSELTTMPIYVSLLNNNQEVPIPWQNIMAASMLFVLPVLVTFILSQRFFVEGITLTGSKG